MGDVTGGAMGALGEATVPVMAVRALRVEYLVDGEWRPAVAGVDFDLSAGEVLAIVGESGSGKTTAAMALLGLLPKNSRTTGSVVLNGRELVGAPARTLRSVRGREISVIFQEPATALNPVYKVGFQIAEMVLSHSRVSPRQARARAVELLQMVELPDPERIVDAYPHQLSGGQRQRVMIAQALALDPGVLVADEPTTALDVRVQAEILALLRDLRHRVDASIVLITHDMGVVADLADRIVVMKDGEVVETGDAVEVFQRAHHPYTRALLRAAPHLGVTIGGRLVGDTGGSTRPAVVLEPAGLGASGAPTAPDPSTGGPRAASGNDVAPVVQLEEVVVEYRRRGRRAAFRAVHDLSLTIGAGEVLGLVGESGSGKTTIGRALAGLLPVTAGRIQVAGVDITVPNRRTLLEVRRQLGYVFQDPGTSLNPRMPVGESVAEPLVRHTSMRGIELRRRVEVLLDRVQLPRGSATRYPHELSGGQRQRVGIARALALNPALLIADEPTSSLDVSVQARVLDLFRELQREQSFACLFVSHDLAVVELVAERVAVMRQGRLVETGPTARILTAAREPYTRQLIAAVPIPDPQAQRARHRSAVGREPAGGVS